jgi:hypothetical protein
MGERTQRALSNKIYRGDIDDHSVCNCRRTCNLVPWPLCHAACPEIKKTQAREKQKVETMQAVAESQSENQHNFIPNGHSAE